MLRRIVSLSISCLIVTVGLVRAHVPEKEGAALQLYSFQMMGSGPAIDGQIDVAWGRAFTREITLTDRKQAALWFMNDDKFLYVAVRYEQADSGNDNGVELYFDEGANTGLMVDDGRHDDELTNPERMRNEDALAAEWQGGKVKTRNLSWGGDDWKTDKNAQAGHAAAATRRGQCYEWEFKIPLNNNHEDNREGADLDVASTDEVGFFIQIAKGGVSKGTYAWEETNRNPKNAGQGTGWADLQLGADRQELVCYVTENLSGVPAIDGNIEGGTAPDKAWQGAYRRDMVLSNFQGSTLPAVLFLSDNPAQKLFYVGLKVMDRTENPDDYCAVYFEENNILPSEVGNMVLDKGLENGLKLKKAGLEDLYWDGLQWARDVKTPANQKGKSAFYPTGEMRYEFEYEVTRNGKDEDLQLRDGAAAGFWVHYHDDYMPVGKQDFFWEYTANYPALVFDSTGNLAAGWAVVQTGAPFLQVISPKDQEEVGGGYQLRVALGEKAGGRKIAAVEYRVAGEESWKELSPVAGSREWSAIWKTDTKPDGDYTLLFRVKDEVNNLLVTRSLNIQVKNKRALDTSPRVRITTPKSSEVVYGATYVVNFTAEAVAPKTITGTPQFSVDGGKWELSSAPTTHQWNTTSLSRGAHFIQVRVTDSEGMMTESKPLLVQINNAPPIAQARAFPEAVKNGDLLRFLVYAKQTGLNVRIPADQLKLLDNQAAADLPCVDLENNGIYTADYPIKALNQAATGAKKIKALVVDAQGNRFEPVCGVVLDNSVPVINTVQIEKKENLFRNGEELVLAINCDTAGYDLTVDCGALDDGYVPGQEVVERAAAQNYRAAYRISQENARKSGKYQVKVTARDRVGLLAQKVVEVFLDNNGPTVTALALADADRVINKNDELQAVLQDSQNIVTQAEFCIDVIAPAGQGLPLILKTAGATPLAPLNAVAPLDLVRLAEGKHTAYVRGRDLAGNWGAVRSLGFVVDRQGPAIEGLRVTYPAGQTMVRDGQAVLVTAKVTDAVCGVAPATVTLDASALVANAAALPLNDRGENGDYAAGDQVYSVLVKPDQSKNGALAVSITAADTIGNMSVSARVLVLLDNQPPVVGDVSVANLDPLFRNGESIRLKVQADGEGYALRADFKNLDDQYQPSREDVADLGQGSYLVTYLVAPTNQMPDGEYVVTVQARDAVGLTGAKEVRLDLDNRGPAIDELGLKDADDVLNADDEVQVKITDQKSAVRAAEFFVDAPREPGSGTPLRAPKDAFKNPVETAAAGLAIKDLAEGRHTLYARAQDAAGNWGTLALCPFLIDREPPQVTNVRVEYPGRVAAVGDGQKVLVSAAISDRGRGVDTATVTLWANELGPAFKETRLLDNGQEGDRVAGDGMYSREITVKCGESGPRALAVSAADLVPNRSRKVAAVVMADNTVPKITDIKIMDDDQVVGNGQLVRLLVITDGRTSRAQADFSRLDSRYQPQMELAQPGAETTAMAYTIQAGNELPDGEYEVPVTVWDSVGLSAIKTIKLVLDNSGPEVTRLELDDKDKVINTLVVVTGVIKEKEQNIRAAEYFLDRVLEPGSGFVVTGKGGAAFTGRSEDVRLEINPAQLAQGPHTIFVRAQNAAGRWGKVAGLSFLVDTRLPQAGAIQVNYPRPMRLAKNNDQVVIAVTLTDAGIGLDSTTVRLDASELGGGKPEMNDNGLGADVTARDNVYTASVEIKAKTAGPVAFTITAADRVPNTLTLTGKVNCDPQAPELTLAIAELGDKLKGKVAASGITLTGSYADADVEAVSIDFTDEKGAARPNTPMAVPVTTRRNFQYKLNLEPGKNLIEVTARDRAGNETKKECEITYEVPQVK
jgi:hypothetical protein